MMKRLALTAVALSIAILGTAYTQPPGAAGLVWLDNALEFDLNAGVLVTTGAVSTTITIPDQNPILLTKNSGTLDVQLDLAALVGIPGLPTITVTGTALSGGSQINWSVGEILINRCVTVSGVNVLIKKITGGNLRVNATILNTPYHSNLANRDFWVRMEDTGGDQFNYLNVEAYAFCTETAFTRINATVRGLDYVIYSGPVPEPASLLALGTGLVSMLALRRRRN